MPLIKNISNIEDTRFVTQLDRLDGRNQFIRELARILLSDNEDVESVWSIANRVYDRHSSPRSESLDRHAFDRPARTALIA
jgi:hypothetical protein